MSEPIMHDAKASCQVRPTAIIDAAAFQPAVPKAVEPQYKGKLYQVQVLSSGGVGSRLDCLVQRIDDKNCLTYSLLDHFTLPTFRCSP